jgi:hypothetical protein
MIDSSAAQPFSPAADPIEIRRTLAILCEPGAVYELRALNTRYSTCSGYFTDLAKMADDAVGCSDRLEAEGVYVTLNSVNRDLLARGVNRVSKYAKYTTADSDVGTRRWLLVDFDPVRS